MQAAGLMLRSAALTTARPPELVVPTTTMEKSLQSTPAMKVHMSSSATRTSFVIPRIAIDCGNVISITRSGSKNLSAVMDTIPSEDCIRAVSSIVRTFGPDNVFVLSKCQRAMQQAVVVMLGRSNFFQQTGLLPANVLFCTLRSGGAPPFKEAMRLLNPPNNYGLFSGYAQDFVHGPRYAPGNVGKGALATTFSLTSLIDDSSECLASFYFEGLLRKHPDAGILLQALWGSKVTPSLTRRHIACHCWDDVLSHLHKHSRDKEPVIGQRTQSEAASTQSGFESDAASLDSVAASSSGECAGGALSFESAQLASSANMKIQAACNAGTGANSCDIDMSTHQLSTDFECGKGPCLGAFGACAEDSRWYCKECQEAFLSQHYGAIRPMLAKDTAESVQGMPSCDKCEVDHPECEAKTCPPTLCFMRVIMLHASTHVQSAQSHHSLALLMKRMASGIARLAGKSCLMRMMNPLWPCQP